MNADGLPNLVGPGGDEIRIIDRLGERHELQVTHGRGEHRVDEDLIRNQACYQRPSVVLVLLLLPVTPGDGVAGKAGIHILVDDCAPGCLGNVYRGFHDADLLPLGDRHTLGIHDQSATVILLVNGIALLVGLILVEGQARGGVDLIYFPGLFGVHQHVVGLAVSVVAGDLGLTANAGHVLSLRVRLELRLQQLLTGVVGGTGLIEVLGPLELLSFHAKVLHSVTAHDDDVGLSLHAVVVGVTEQHVDALYQLHLDLTPVCAKSTAVRKGVGVKVEVSAVIAGLGAVKKGVPDPVIELELLQQIGDLGVGEHRGIVVGVRHVAAVIIGQRLKPQSCAGAGQRRDEQGGHPLQNVESRLRQSSHGGGIGQVEPLIADEELRIGVHQIVLVRHKAAVVVPTVLVKLPGLGGIVLHYSLSPPYPFAVFMPYAVSML